MISMERAMPRVVGKNGEKTDFTDEISEKQKIIRTQLGNIGWSISQFAGNYCYGTNDYDIDDEDYLSCKEKIKKQIISKCKSRKILGELVKYINYIENTDEFKNSNQLRLQTISDNILDENLKDALTSISKNIDIEILTKQKTT